MLGEVLMALQELRPPFALYEMDLHQMVGALLTQKQIANKHEAPLSRGCRIDFLVGDIGIEIKKGKPAPKQLKAQLCRYLESPLISGLIVVSQRSVTLPDTLMGKPVKTLCLQQLWGVALP